MTGSLQRLADLSILVFVVSSMLAMGMSQRLADVIAPLRRPLPVVLALVVNFALSPLLALGVEPDHSAAAGARHRPAAAQRCRRRAIPAQACRDLRRQPRLLGRPDDAADGRQHGIHAVGLAAHACRRWTPIHGPSPGRSCSSC